MNIWTNIIYISLPFWRLWGIKPNSYHLQSHCHVRSRCFPATVSLATNLKRPLTEDCCSMNISSVSWWNITDFIIFHKNIMKKEKSFFHCISNLELHPLCSQTRKGSTSVFFFVVCFFCMHHVLSSSRLSRTVCVSRWSHAVSPRLRCVPTNLESFLSDNRTFWGSETKSKRSTRAAWKPPCCANKKIGRP